MFLNTIVEWMQIYLQMKSAYVQYANENILYSHLKQIVNKTVTSTLYRSIV